MRKIPTLFIRDPDDMRHLTREVHPDCQWVIDGDGVPTRKYDGTCVMLDESGRWWSRREVRAEKTPPPGFVAVETDSLTLKTVGWEPAEQSAWRRYLAEAIGWLTESSSPPMVWEPGTYELVGPKINRNPEGSTWHQIVRHDHAQVVKDVPRDYDGLAAFLADCPYEGIVWHHPDGRMAKIKRKDFSRVENRRLDDGRTRVADDVPMPGEWNPAYAGDDLRPALEHWLRTHRTQVLHLPIPLDEPELCAMKTHVLEMRKAFAFAPYVGRPFVYLWRTATDELGRSIAGDTEIRYVQSQFEYQMNRS